MCKTKHKATEFGTSPAPKNTKVWSAKAPPTNLRAATSPAKTTDAVPCTKGTVKRSPVNEYKFQ